MSMKKSHIHTLNPLLETVFPTALSGQIPYGMNQPFLDTPFLDVDGDVTAK
jgi:hypothetical protein